MAVAKLIQPCYYRVGTYCRGGRGIHESDEAVRSKILETVKLVLNYSQLNFALNSRKDFHLCL